LRPLVACSSPINRIDMMGGKRIVLAALVALPLLDET
jgi:hypothetical protein